MTHPKRRRDRNHRAKPIIDIARVRRPAPLQMLEQRELTNFEPEYQFVVRQYAIGKGRSASVLWRGEVDTIFGFEREADRSNGSGRSRKAGCLLRSERLFSSLKFRLCSDQNVGANE
jgi:hypothetical protein